MMRLALVCLLAGLVVAERYPVECADDAGRCDRHCCSIEWDLQGDVGDYKCVKDGKTCGLCGQDSLDACTFTVVGAGLPYATLLDENDKPVEIITREDPVGGAASGSLPATKPSAGITLTLGTFNGMKGWLDIPNSAFYRFREFLQGITATIPSFYTASGYTVQYSCQSKGLANSDEADFKGCDIFFFIYRCPPCEAESGNIAAQLLASEDPVWYADYCGPVFKLDKTKDVAEHQFAAYQAEIPDKKVVNVKATGPVTFIFWAMVGKNVICASKDSLAECQAFPESCQWLADTEVCRPRGCYQGKFSGPNLPRCQTCVYDEEELIPEVIGA
ncbi:hypothetical protein DIPPA_24467 [Diplonema papillatum]|nr:hypothetical protein DIPPA_24467 [Diplonema papillatum]